MELVGDVVRRVLLLGALAVFAFAGVGTAMAADAVPTLPAAPSEMPEGVEAPPTLETENAVKATPVEEEPEVGVGSVDTSGTSSGSAEMNPVLFAFLTLLGVFAIAWMAVNMAKGAGIARAWTVVGVPVLLIGGLGVAYAMNQVKPSADVVAGVCTPSNPQPANPTAKAIYFLAQAYDGFGASVSRVVKLSGEELIQKARSEVAAYKQSPGSGTFALKGRFLQKPDPLTPASTWSWDEATYSLDVQRTDITPMNACSGTQRPELRDLKPVAAAVVTDYCPISMYLTAELGESLPAAKHTLTVGNFWTYAGVPGVNMKLDAAGAAALKGGTLKVFTYNSGLGQNIAITDPNYAFHAGEGYYFISTSGQVQINLEGVVSQVEWIKLTRGWNFVSFPHATKRTIDRVKTLDNLPGMTAKEAVDRKVLNALVYAYGWENNQYKLYMPKSPAELSATTMPGERGFWMYANQDVIVTFK